MELDWIVGCGRGWTFDILSHPFLPFLVKFVCVGVVKGVSVTSSYLDALN